MNERFEKFTVLIAKINRNIKKIKNNAMAEYGLRSAHVSCLYYLYLFDSLTATELCERCEEDKATISRAIDYLEESGYIICNSKMTKRYKTPLFLTDKGKKVAKKISEKVSYVLDDVSVALSEAERLEFYRCLEIVSNSIEKCVN